MQESNAIPAYRQIHIFHDIYEDDEILLNTPGAEWYVILKEFPWIEYQELAALYYESLYDFNKINATKQKDSSKIIEAESKENAKQKLLFGRATMDKSKPIIYNEEFKKNNAPKIYPSTIAPGFPPLRLGGKQPKCFFALFKSFIGTTLMGFPPEPSSVHSLLTSNLSFARVCGFIQMNAPDHYWSKHVPSLRKLEQFDQIMTEYGLWNQNKWEEVKKNIENGTIKKETELVGDTTHYFAFSGFETVKYETNNGKEKTKSQSKLTKKCNCKDKNICPHEWELRDDGAGTIVKSNKKMIWGHKASVIGLPKQGIPLDASAVSDAATNDGKTFFPHVELVFEKLPAVEPWIERVLYDSACCDQNLKNIFREEYGIELFASFNPRRSKSIEKNLPVGMKKITPHGNLICNGGFDMEFQGARYDLNKFIYHQVQTDENEKNICQSCKFKSTCSPNSNKGRVVTIPFDILPQIDSNDPPMAKRFKAIMTRRPSVERMIKRLKCDLSDDRLSKRGNSSFQAYLDKTLIAFHILIRK